MIHLEQPSIALNDPRLRNPTGNERCRYQMWRTWDLSKFLPTRGRVINYVASLARGAPNGGKVKNLVINCHGYPGYLQLGEGFDENSVSMFVDWFGLFETIWIMGCLVARNPNVPISVIPAAQQPRGDGHWFCSTIAILTGADVIASTEIQASFMADYPYGYISDLEGRVNLYEGETGQISAWTRNRSSWQDAQGQWHGTGETGQ